MSTADSLAAKYHRRWANAARNAQGLADNGMGRAVKAYYAFYFPVAVGALMLTGTLGAALVLGSRPADWPLYATFGLLLAALGALIGGLIYDAKKVRPAAELGTTDVMLWLEGAEQRHVRQQILGKTAVVPEHLGVARGAAVQLRKSQTTKLILAPVLPLAFMPQAVPGRSDLWWLMAILIGTQFIAGGFVARDFLRSGRFLTGTRMNRGR